MADVEVAELLPRIERVLTQFPTAQIYLKWTCPGCGDRVTAEEPNAFHTGGYDHVERENGTPCGSRYTGTQFGMLLVASGLNAADVLRLLHS